jgi:hypothetical protein
MNPHKQRYLNSPALFAMPSSANDATAKAKRTRNVVWRPSLKRVVTNCLSVFHCFLHIVVDVTQSLVVTIVTIVVIDNFVRVVRNISLFTCVFFLPFQLGECVEKRMAAIDAARALIGQSVSQSVTRFIRFH